MSTKRNTSLLGVFLLAGGLAHGAASPLDSYLLRATDLPPGCQTVAGSFPAGPKIAALYQYTAYQSVLPKLRDRHAQSFSCGGQQGSIYYFEYASSADKDSAALFAKPVLAKEAAGWVDWPTGFAVVSFKEVPAPLLSAVEGKVKGSGTVTTAAAQNSCGWHPCGFMLGTVRSDREPGPFCGCDYA